MHAKVLPPRWQRPHRSRFVILVNLQVPPPFELLRTLFSNFFCIVICFGPRTAEATRTLSPPLRRPLGMVHGSGTINVTAQSIKEQLERESFVVVRAREMWPLLGVAADTASALAALWDEAVPQIDEAGHEVYPFKGTLVTYYDLDTVTYDAPRRAPGHDHTRDCGAERAIEHIDPTTQHDASFYRLHKQWPRAADAHPAVRAMQRLLAEVLAASPAAPAQAVGSAAEATGAVRIAGVAGAGAHAATAFEAMMSGFRVTRSSAAGRFASGEPGPEGVHQDSRHV